MKAILLLLFLAAAGFGGNEARLQGFDALVPRENRKAVLRVKLEKIGALGINPDLHNEEIVFRCLGAEIGKAQTKGDGIASFEWTFPLSVTPVYEYEVAISPSPSSAYRCAAEKLRIFHRDPKRRSLVVDLDGTVCASTEWDVATKPASELQARPGAAEVLQDLSASYDILYLTARDDSLISRTREWLDLRKFPHGPILVRDLKLWNLSAEKYKKERLLAMRKEWNLFAGFGDRDEDAEAYMAAGLEAYLIGKPTKIPQGARKLVSWEEIGKLLKP